MSNVSAYLIMNQIRSLDLYGCSFKVRFGNMSMEEGGLSSAREVAQVQYCSK